jgi:hypothetical protein
MFLTKTDHSVVLAGRDFASRHEFPRRLEVIDFGTPPRKCSRHVGATRRQLTCKVYACEEMYCDCIIVSECNTILLYRSTLYIQYVIRDETKVSVPIICALRFCIFVLRRHRDFY